MRPRNGPRAGAADPARFRWRTWRPETEQAILLGSVRLTTGVVGSARGHLPQHRVRDVQVEKFRVVRISRPGRMEFGQSLYPRFRRLEERRRDYPRAPC